MRGKSSIAKLRLRSGGYKCNLCGRRVIDVATLERHHKTVHNIQSKRRKIVLKAKPSEQKRKLNDKVNEKAFDELLKDEDPCEAKPSQKKSSNNNERVRVRNEILAECKPNELIKKDPEPEKNGDAFQIENNDVKPKRGRKSKGDQRRVEFECPVCSKKFNVYYTAHRHIQKFHPVNAKGEKVPINSLSLIQPIRLEQCVKCTCKIKSIEQHTCHSNAPDDTVGLASQFVCSACNQSFVSIKTFDLHVAGLHSNGVDSMFFPTLIEFTNWRLEMERETDIKYSILGEYDSKKIYRCNYARENCLNDLSTSYFCPSSVVVQALPKGIQVHFYPEHHDHPSREYTLAGKYRRYSITSFLKNPDALEIEDNVSTKKLEDKDLYPQFEQLMQSVIVDARFLDVPRLRLLIEKALDMTTVLISGEEKVDNVAPKLNKSLSDQEISEALEYKNLVQKRRMSADSFKEELSSPAKRTRNRSVFTQNGDRSSPKIINTFSLAIKDPLETESFELKNDSSVEIVNVSNEETKSEDTDTKTNKPSRGYKATRFTQSPSFNDTYKDFIDKTIKATMAAVKGAKRGPKIKERNTKSIPVGNIKMEPIKPASPKNSPATDVQTSPNATSNDNVTANVKTVDVKRIHNTTITKIKMEDTSNLSSSDNEHTPKSERNSVCKNFNSEMDFNETDRTATPTCLLRPKLEIEYEVREQENDCNILILKI